MEVWGRQSSSPAMFFSSFLNLRNHLFTLKSRNKLVIQRGNAAVIRGSFPDQAASHEMFYMYFAVEI